MLDDTFFRFFRSSGQTRLRALSGIVLAFGFSVWRFICACTRRIVVRMLVACEGTYLKSLSRMLGIAASGADSSCRNRAPPHGCGQGPRASVLSKPIERFEEIMPRKRGSADWSVPMQSQTHHQR